MLQNNKILVIISTHVLNKAIVQEFNKLKNSINYECILFIDNTKNILNDFKYSELTDNMRIYDFWGNNIKCFVFDETVLQKINLPMCSAEKEDNSIASVMWMNGDYRFYIINNYLPHYDYYWQFDYDCFCNGNSYKPFFERYKTNSDCNVLFFNKFEKGNEDLWYWFKKTDWIYKNVSKYSSFFPIVGLSSEAIKFLYKRRLKHYEIYKEKNVLNSDNIRWINCECFVPTELMNNGYTCSRIDKPCGLTNIDLNVDRIFEKPDFKIYHPVKTSHYKTPKKELTKKVNKHKIYKFLGFKISIKNKGINNG